MFKRYNSIEQFRNTVKKVQITSDFKGLDVEGQPIYEHSPKPTIKFKGTVKLHGTNAQVCYSPESGVVAGKRSSLLNTNDLGAHMGFNQFVQVNNIDYFYVMLAGLWIKHCVKGEQIILYGEWAGKNIQKGVAISQLDKSFYIVEAAIVPTNPDADNPVATKWVDLSNIQLEENPKVFLITDFPTYIIDIDFSNPELSRNKMVEITNKVEEECPVAKQLGVSGIGEGIVWTAFYREEKLQFKVKGEKHSVSKVKTLAAVNPEVVTSIIEFVEYATTENRMNQAIKETNPQTKADTGTYLRWVANDIMKEEADVLVSNSLEWKQVAGKVSQKARLFLFNHLEKQDLT